MHSHILWFAIRVAQLHHYYLYCSYKSTQFCWRYIKPLPLSFTLPSFQKQFASSEFWVQDYTEFWVWDEALPEIENWIRTLCHPYLAIGAADQLSQLAGPRLVVMCRLRPGWHQSTVCCWAGTKTLLDVSDTFFEVVLDLYWCQQLP